MAEQPGIDKEQRILEATGRLLASHGFHGLSMQLVAKEAGVAAGTIYRYFDSKTALIVALHAKIVTEAAQQLFRDYDAGASLEDRYRYLWNRTWEIFLGSPEVLLCKHQFDRLPTEQDLQRMRELEERHFAPWQAFLEEGRQQGVFKDLPDELLSSLSIEVCFGLAYKEVTGLVNLTPSQLDAAMEASWHALAHKTRS
ncbi:TetR/AcrR family transcriptional regulator [Gallaecimonas kandeliae]|uniref:TetR/AcrR family transcriptional regulator n=1 Tax=Gallaecimonas kandeliae TaxID=3029055 RepID=UPI002649F331|nr:TetR/AcrR family transcriptional regulator [Gallaecimonas kandeliae]WKE65612.1 TetR/AcrR family transcriptional regulator [Gallaecimonas kandeliae]